MFYLLLSLFLLIIFMLLQNRKKNQNYPVVLILPYFVSLFSIILYVSKDTYYYHLMKNYFYLPDYFWRWLFFIKLDKAHIIRLMNISSLSILIISTYFVIRLYTYRSSMVKLLKNVKIIIWIYCIFQAIIFDPFINRTMYYWLYPDYLDVYHYSLVENTIYAITHAINILIVIACLLWLIYVLLKAPKLKLFRFHHLFLLLSYGTLTYVYIYFISSCPNFYLKFSKISGIYSFRSIPLGSNALIYRALPYILIPAAGIIVYCVYMLTKLSGQDYLKELRISKEISSSETTSKIFCHYIKNEVLAIQSEAEALRDTFQGQNSLDNILYRCDALYKRIDEIHRSTKTSELNLKWYSLQNLIEETLSLFSKERATNHIELNFPSHPIGAMIDPVYMEQALHNILRNAFDAMEDLPIGARKLDITLETANQWIKIDIRDNGKGISEENLENIFLPFYSSYPYSKHWGVGLTLTYKVIHAHEGKIMADSSLGTGTTIEILLPKIT
ncbi:MAG TPA: HAMP domain-containing histidine kinase [Candidatus Pelethocola excrementipullorum]|nr:HAMP domain-containing histidine kinase [Candidatus Pelethocola excrementipullorum]